MCYCPDKVMIAAFCESNTCVNILQQCTSIYSRYRLHSNLSFLITCRYRPCVLMFLSRYSDSRQEDISKYRPLVAQHNSIRATVVQAPSHLQLCTTVLSCNSEPSAGHVNLCFSRFNSRHVRSHRLLVVGDIYSKQLDFRSREPVSESYQSR